LGSTSGGIGSSLGSGFCSGSGGSFCSLGGISSSSFGSGGGGVSSGFGGIGGSFYGSGSGFFCGIHGSGRFSSGRCRRFFGLARCCNQRQRGDREDGAKFHISSLWVVFW
jgi:hypothetical protein